MLQRALDLLRQMDEFSQSRFRLESRYHHVLVDEFQDTSRAQWELVSLLIQSWGEGLGLATAAVDLHRRRPQAVDLPLPRRRGRGAPVGRPLHRGAAADRRARGARSAGASAPCRSCWHSSTTLFAGDVAAAPGAPTISRTARRTGFRWTRPGDARRGGPVLGVAAGDDAAACAAAVAFEIERLLREETIRDRQDRRAREPRARATSRSSSGRGRAIVSSSAGCELRGIPTYVYKGLGFFDADEIKDLSALMRFLADPCVRPAGRGIPAVAIRAAIGPWPGAARAEDRRVALLDPHLPASAGALLEPRIAACSSTCAPRVPGWLAQVDRVPPAELIER